MEYKDGVYEEQLNVIFRQTPTIIGGGVVAGPTFVWLFWKVANHTELLIWLACFLALLAARVLLYVVFLRSGKLCSRGTWGKLYTSSTFLQSLLWGSVWLIFAQTGSDPAYSLAIAICLLALSAVSVSAYSVHLPSLFAFFFPIIIPSIVYFLMNRGEFFLQIAIVLTAYIVVVLRGVLPIHRSLISSIRLNFELNEEVSKRKMVEDKLRELSILDGLTGLANRRHFNDTLDKELKRAQRQSTQLSLILLDIDFFKAYNDHYGHVKGDECLKRVSSCIRTAARRPGDLAARYGGEEFSVILPDTEAKGAYAVGENIRTTIKNLNIAHACSCVEGCDSVTVSAGIATLLPDKDITADDLINKADEALYAAKERGRNQSIAADPT